MAKKSNVYYCTACGYESSGWLGKCPNCGAWNSFEEKPAPVKEKKVTQAGVSTGWLDDLLDNYGLAADSVGKASVTDNEGLNAGDNPEEIAVNPTAEVTATSSTAKTASTSANPLDANTSRRRSKVVPLSSVDSVYANHYSTGISEFDRVLGGGFVPGSLVLVGGEPGIGKSTLLLQAASSCQADVLYICGEESVQQVKARADRLNLKSKQIKLTSEIVFERLAPIIQRELPRVCIVDSIQTIYSEQSSSAPGSVSQVRDCSAGFLRLAKSLGITIVLVGHVTKDGNLAGPRILEHMVDTVIYFEGDKYSNMRLVRAVKNRFGATNEVGLFEMTRHGLSPVNDASQNLLSGRPENVSGSALTCIIEGTRPLVIEIQALLTTSSYATPMRVTQGFNRNRVSMLIALTEKRLNIGLGDMDAFVNVVNGFKADDPATDLALVAALVSSFKDKAVKEKLLLCGEVGLTGEVRSIANVETRVKEAGELGFKALVLPGSNSKQVKKMQLKPELEVIFVDSISEAMDIIW